MAFGTSYTYPFSRKGLDPITKNYINGMVTKPSSDHIKLINDLVKAIKPIINKADVIYLMNINNSNDSFRNLVKDAHHGAINGSNLVFDEYWGWSNPSGDTLINTNYNPYTDGINYQKDNAAYACYIQGSNQPAKVQYVMGSFQSTAIRTSFAVNSAVATVNYVINDGANNSVGGVAFMSGYNYGSRESLTTKKFRNRNILDTTNSVTSSNVPNVNWYLFGLEFSSISYPNYTGNLSFVYIGASLTEDENRILDDAVNDYLIQCLFLKYGQDNWGVKMTKSYFLDLHNFEKYEAWEVYEFIKRHQSDYIDGSDTGYLYNTFNTKQVADYILLFKAGGNLISNVWTKAGDTLRWNQDGMITINNTMPAYTRGESSGIITVTTTDSFDNVNAINIGQTNNSVNSFYGNFPQFEKIKTSDFLYIFASQNRCKINLLSNPLIIRSFVFANISTVGYILINLDTYVGASLNGYFTISNPPQQTKVYGNMSLYTNEFNSGRPLIINGNISNILDLNGTLNNWVYQGTYTQINIQYTNLTGGLLNWNRNLDTVYFSNNYFSTDAVDAQLKAINDYFTTTTPITDLALNLSGANMGIPTGGANNTDLLGIIAKHSAAGFTATITIRTS